MIKKKLSNQLILIYTLVLVVLTIVFSIFVNSKLNEMYITENYNRIEHVLQNLSSSQNELSYIPLDVCAVTKKSGDSTLKFNNENIYRFKESYINSLLNEINGEFPTRIEKNFQNEKFYFVGYQKGNVKYLVFSDSNYIASRINSNIIQLILIFVGILFVGVFVINLYSRKIVSRILFVKDNINSKDIIENYEEKFFDDEITDLSKSLFKMKKELYLQEKIKEEMLQNISHDFKTPIAVIKSYSEAIKDGIVGVEDVDVILKQTDILNKKVFQLLEITKLEYLINQNLELSEINVLDIINNCLKNFSLINSNLDIKINCEGFYLNGIYENIYTAFENLLDNSFRYAKNVIEITSTDDFVKIYNDGPNISDEILEKIYKPYEKSTDGKFGLGMSIVKRTFDMFNIKMEINNLEIGVEFIIYKNDISIN